MGTSTECMVVNYEDEEDAESAIEAMNQDVLGENVITVERLCIESITTDDHLTSCFIDNCPDHFDDDLLRSTFEKYGTVVFAKVMVNDRGVTRGLGFVSFKEFEDATQAVRDLDGRMIQNKRIHVFRVLKKKEEKGFVSLDNREDGNKAIHEMNDKSESQEQPPQPINPFFGYQNIARPLIPPWSLQIPFPLRAAYMWPQSNLMTRPYGPPIIQYMSSFQRPISLGPGSVKLMLVQSLYPTVFKYEGLRAGPIMAKLMDLDIAELSGMIENNVLLLTKIQKIMEDFSKIAQPIVELDSKSVSTQNTNNSGIKTAEVESSSSEDISGEDEFYGESKVELGKKILPFVMGTARGLSTEKMDELQKLDKATKEEYLKLKLQGFLSNPEQEIKEVKNNGNFRRKKTFPDTDPRTQCIVPNRDSLAAKQLLGDKIYPLVAKVAGDLAGKITGMLLELDITELLNMVENEDSLRLKVEEAMELINARVVEGCCRWADKTTAEGPRWHSELGKDDTSRKTAEEESSSSEESSDEYFSGVESYLKNKVALGKKILPFVKRTAGDLSIEIMHGLMKLDKVELLYMIENEDCLKLKIERLRCSLTNPGPDLKETFPGTDPRTQRIVSNRDSLEGKQLLGNKIYPLVAKVAGDLAGKITGMLLELDITELLNMVENEDSLRLKVEEAMAAINASVVEGCCRWADKTTIKGPRWHSELGKDDTSEEASNIQRQEKDANEDQCN